MGKLPTSHDRWVRIATKLAADSPHPIHKMACVIVRGGRILGQATNLAERYKHAEIRALRPHHDFTGATLYVVRLNGKVSTPCNMCAEAIKQAGISKVVSVNWQSTHEITKVA